MLNIAIFIYFLQKNGYHTKRINFDRLIKAMMNNIKFISHKIMKRGEQKAISHKLMQ